MYQSSDPGFQRDLDTFAPASADSLALTSSSGKNTEFITAVGVYELLNNLGVTMVDVDTMEIQMTKSGTSPGISLYSAGTRSYSSLLSSPPLAFQPPSTTTRLDVPLLMSRLMHVGVCFKSGPRYPRGKCGGP